MTGWGIPVIMLQGVTVKLKNFLEGLYKERAADIYNLTGTLPLRVSMGII